LDCRWFHCKSSLTYVCQPHWGPEFESASNINEYQKYFMGGKGDRCRGLPVVLKYGSLNLQDSSRPAQVLSSHICLGLSGPFSSGFPTKNLLSPLLVPIRSTCLAHSILLHLILLTTFGAQYRPLSCTLCSFLHSPCYHVPHNPKCFFHLRHP
jgi:hypothetical protein